MSSQESCDCVTVNNPTVPATTGYDTLTAHLAGRLAVNTILVRVVGVCLVVEIVVEPRVAKAVCDSVNGKLSM